ncbi:MAG: NAD(P)-binding domain-containing protein, partial [Zoogloea sp.]|nr:NAD(P)-binding domain-containing protein [Zoogloea sp.]
MKITFLGGGNMAAALIGGLLKQGFKAEDLQAVELSAEGRSKLAGNFGVRAVENLDEQALACDVLVLAVKPQQLRDAVAPVAGRLTRQVVVSIAAGLRLVDIGRWLGGYGNLVRAMPNTPALIGAGITGLFASAG